MARKLGSALILLFLVVPLAARTQAKIALPERYKKWLDEEIVYIITPHERDIFLHLQTDKERDIFIEAFWKQRDPNPGTPRNEFREEHYQRLKYANDVYGRSSLLPGWKTDRGRVYIVLGPPKHVESYDQVQDVYPVEVWFYMGDPALGLPPAFNIVFFKRNGIGDYVLYSPAQDGPVSLLADVFVSDDNPEDAYNTLKKYEPNLAYQTLSLIPGEQTRPGSVSLASTRLLATVFASPQKKVEDAYADAILKYKDFVDVEYTANYVPSEASLQVIRDAPGVFMVHYSIEPGKISVEDAGGKYDVRFQVTGRVSDSAGRTVYQFDRDFPFTLTPEALQAVRAQSISLQDMFPLAPGSYSFDLLLKNLASKEFSSAEGKIVIPGEISAPQMTPLLLAYRAENMPAGSEERVPFKVGSEQILCQSRKSFGTKDTLVIFFQVYGLTDEIRASGSLRFAFFKEDKPFSERQKKIGDFGQGDDFVEIQDLASFPPGYYQVAVSLVGAKGREVAGRKENFEVITVPVFPRPMVISKVMPSLKREEYLYATGLQYFNKGELTEAGTRLAEAYARSPQRPDFALAYSQVLFRQGDFARAKEILLPLAAGEEPSAEVLALLGQACHALNQFQEALTYYTSYISRYGMNIDILNYLGTCYFQLGNRGEALKAWTRSLELSPNQEKIKALVESLKKK
ncbi:MAG: GWxTD domain-containing protein [Candidatus Aminicenantales bacterium]|jgi:GWxTD domain-containing protein